MMTPPTTTLDGISRFFFEQSPTFVKLNQKTSKTRMLTTTTWGLATNERMANAEMKVALQTTT
jgi:hypothetical protein